MIKKKQVYCYTAIVILLCMCLTLPSIFPADSHRIRTKNATFNSDEFPDLFPHVDRLSMLFPPGESLGTFEEYIEKYPYQPARFQSIYESSYRINVKNTTVVGILIDSSLYQKIQNEISQYISDVESSGYHIFVETLQGGTPIEVKKWMRNHYENDTVGFLFIGDIPAAWAEVSAAVFPCDLFYMDLDGEWVDINEDDIFESHWMGAGDVGPEVYVGRLFASSLSWNTDWEMIRDYFQKIHAYRTGELSVPLRGIEYVDEDWYDMSIGLSNVFGSNVSRYDFGFSTTAFDYLNTLNQSQQFVQVCAHSYPGGHHFGTRPTQAVSYAHVYVYSPSDREVKLLLGVDDGIKIWVNNECIFEKDKYNGWYQKDQYRIDTFLRKGWNQVLCKVSQEGGDYSFSVRFTDQNYQTMSDIFYQSTGIDEGKTSPVFIRSWLTNGFHEDNPDNFYQYLFTNYVRVPEATLHPQLGEVHGGKQWMMYNASSAVVNLNSLYPNSDYGCSYAYVTVHSNTTQSCQLSVGSDDGLRAWLNGEEIICENRYGALEIDMVTINVTLQSGENHLLFKISEWMGDYGFSACFHSPTGEAVPGLSYTPEMNPITYIGTWLINGVYEHKNQSDRLSIDYIDGEATIQPYEHMNSGPYIWEQGIGDGAPFNLGSFFDKGEWVFSETIQRVDPPVLFYNLFSCGPGRFTDENYLAGSYVFNTTYGLISIASAKSGSMLAFEDFYEPLGNNACIGQAFYEWFDTQAPYDLWEKEWYYGMMICGDPLLTLCTQNTTPISLSLIQPEPGIYVKNKKLLPFLVPCAFGNITIVADGVFDGVDLTYVSLLIDEQEVMNSSILPLHYDFSTWSLGRHTISVCAKTVDHRLLADDIALWKFF